MYLLLTNNVIYYDNNQQNILKKRVHIFHEHLIFFLIIRILNGLLFYHFYCRTGIVFHDTIWLIWKPGVLNLLYQKHTKLQHLGQ